jgi:hypothetical protein
LKGKEPLVGVAGCSLPDRSCADLGECSALLETACQGELDRLTVLPGVIDVLAQEIVAIVAAEDYDRTGSSIWCAGLTPIARSPAPSSRPPCGSCPEATAGRWGRRALNGVPLGA